MVGSTERFNAREVFERRSDRGAPFRPRTQRLVDPEEVAVAMDQDDRLTKGGGFLLNLTAHFGIAARILRCSGEWRGLRKQVRLLHDHDGEAVDELCVLECFVQPGEVSLIVLAVFRVALGRPSEPVVAAWDMQRQKCHTTEIPAHVLGTWRTSDRHSGFVASA